jgi:adenylate cyclase
MRFKFQYLFLILLLTFLSASAQSPESNPELDSLQKVLAGNIHDTSKVLAHIRIAEILRKSNKEKALEHARTAQVLSQKTGFTFGLALAYKQEGFYYYYKTQFDSTEYYWLKAMKEYERTEDFDGVSNMYNNIGSIYFNMGNYKRALGYFVPALEAAEQIDKSSNVYKLRNATPTLNIGLIYMQKPGGQGQAFEYLEKARKLGEEIQNDGIIGATNSNIGEIWLGRGNDSLALHHLMIAKKALEPDALTLPHVYNTIGRVYIVRKNYDEARKWLELGYTTSEDNNLYKSDAAYYLGEVFSEEKNHKKALDYFNEARQLAEESQTLDQLKKSYKGLSKTFSELDNFELAYRNEVAYSMLSDSLASLKADSAQSEYELGLKEREIDLANQQGKLKDEQIKREKLIRNAFLVGFALVVALIVILFRDYKNKIKTNKLLDQRKAEIETLLLNILPFEVAEELQKTGKSNPRYYESTTVMFTDFVGFSRIAETLSPQQITAELNEFFTEMDEIIDRYGIEKIKTIGDSYMCAGGIPTPNTTHPIDVVRAGLDIVEYLKKKNKAREDAGLAQWEIRIGLNTGSLVAGVVGKKKYAYDIWGSAVNIASRMESNGSPGMLNISASTYELIKDKFECEYRGKIYAKNVGEIDMYFVKRELTNGKVQAQTEESVSSEQ